MRRSQVVVSQTLCDLQLAPGVPQGGEQVQFDARLGAQVVLQMLSFVLQCRESGQHGGRVALHTAVLLQSLPKHKQTKDNALEHTYSEYSGVF